MTNNGLELRNEEEIQLPFDLDLNNILSFDYGQTTIATIGSDVHLFNSSIYLGQSKMEYKGGSIFSNSSGYGQLNPDGVLEFYPTQFYYYNIMDFSGGFTLENVDRVFVSLSNFVAHKKDGSIFYGGKKINTFMWNNEDILGVKKYFLGSVSRAFLTKNNQLFFDGGGPSSKLEPLPSQLSKLSCSGGICFWMTDEGKFGGYGSEPQRKVKNFLHGTSPQVLVVYEDDIAEVRTGNSNPVLLSNSVESVYQVDHAFLTLNKDKTVSIYGLQINDLQRGLIENSISSVSKIVAKEIVAGILTENFDLYYYERLSGVHKFEEKVSDIFPNGVNESMLVKTNSGKIVIISGYLGEGTTINEIEFEGMLIKDEKGVIGLLDDNILYPPYASEEARYSNSIRLPEGKEVKSVFYSRESPYVLFEDGTLAVCHKNGNNLVVNSECDNYSNIHQIYRVTVGRAEVQFAVSKLGELVFTTGNEDVFPERIMGQIRSGVSRVEFEDGAYFAIKFNGDRIYLGSETLN